MDTRLVQELHLVPRSLPLLRHGLSIISFARRCRLRSAIQHAVFYLILFPPQEGTSFLFIILFQVYPVLNGLQNLLLLPVHPSENSHSTISASPSCIPTFSWCLLPHWPQLPNWRDSSLKTFRSAQPSPRAGGPLRMRGFVLKGRQPAGPFAVLGAFPACIHPAGSAATRAAAMVSFSRPYHPLPLPLEAKRVRKLIRWRADGSEDCVSQLEASPVCADNTWSLFNIVNGPYDAGKGYFCCQPGQIGLNNGKCVGKGAATATATAAETVSQMAAPVASGPATNDASGSSATDAASTSLDLNQVGGATTVGAAVPTKSSGAVGDSVARDLGVLGVVGGALAMLLL